MEVDWSAEIGPSLPVLDAAWNGFVDLRSFPEKVSAIEEAWRHPILREALLDLNAAGSPLFTTKCDCWKLAGDEIDPDEFAASPETARAGFASYIDIVDRDPTRFESFNLQEQYARAITATLRARDLRQGLVDLVLRAAVLKEQSGFGITLYAAGCGVDEADALAAWQAVLGAAVAATISSITGE